MSFKCDGSNHHKAVISETSLDTNISLIQQIEKFHNKKVKKILSKASDKKKYGGTKNKTDNLIVFEDDSIEIVSLKNKETIYSGSFDYANTTKIKGFNNSFRIYEKYKHSDLDKDATYDILKREINKDLLSLTSEDITNYFIDNVYNKYVDENIKLYIIDEKTNKIYCDVIPPIFLLIKNGGRLVFKDKSSVKNEQGSFTIEGIDINNNIVELNVRIRVHLNNGATQWLKKTKGSSVLCLKFQQDSVYKMINTNE